MRMSLRRLPAVLAALILAAGAAGSALAATDEATGPLARPLSVDLDADGADETVEAREVRCLSEGEYVPPPCADDALAELVPTLRDTCAGQAVAFDLLPRHQFIRIARATELDGDAARPELLLDGRSGASGRAGSIAVWAYRDAGEGCSKPRALFRWPGKATSGRRPRGAQFLSFGAVVAAELRERHPGRELRLREAWADGDDGGCCPTIQRVTDFRFSAKRDRYVRYRTKVKRTA